MKVTLLFIVLTLAALHDVARAGLWAPKPLSSLAAEADVVVVATLESASYDGSQVVRARLRTLGAMKGEGLPVVLEAGLIPSALMTAHGVFTSPFEEDSSGVWFLAQLRGELAIIPLADGDYTWRDAFLPVPSSAVGLVQQGTLSQQLMRLLVTWYSSLSSPSAVDDQRLFVSLDNGSREDALEAVNVLMDSATVRQRVIGLAAAIRIGSDEAVYRLAEEVELLRSDPMFVRITGALEMMYQPRGDPSIAGLERLIGLRSDAPGLDAAAGAALRRVGTKAVLPSMAALLDSGDPQAQLRAASFFGWFTLFADENGEIAGTQMIGPLATPETRSATPRRNVSKSPAEYADYWRAWWAQNRAKLGFASQ